MVKAGASGAGGGAGGGASGKEEIAAWSMTQAAAGLARGEVTSRQLTEIMLERIAASDNNAYITVNPQALAEADAADARRRAGKARSGADGIPVALKDNICVRGLPTTCASRMLANFTPPYSAAVAERLAEAGTVLLGKLNMDEFAMGSTSEHSYFGPVKNPRNPARVAGGSSGGAAAAVAEDLAYLALGTDTGGSVRQPAAFCGAVGLKPTYGRISRFGVVAFASSLDQVGPITKTVADCAWALSLLAGGDPRDSSSLPHPPADYIAGLRGVAGLADAGGSGYGGGGGNGGGRGSDGDGGRDTYGNGTVFGAGQGGRPRIGVPREYMGEGIQAEVRRAVSDLAAKMAAAGAAVEECSLPRAEYALSAYYVISSAEACSNLGRYDGVKYGYRANNYDSLEDMIRRSRSEGFGDEVKRRILLGTYTLSAGYFDAYYKRAQQARTLIMEDFRQAFQRYDALLIPTSPVTAWRRGADFADPSAVYAMDLCTVSVNVAGLPAISLPWGTDGDGLPIGAQLIGAPLSEALLLRIAHGAEELGAAVNSRRPNAGIGTGPAVGAARDAGAGSAASPASGSASSTGAGSAADAAGDAGAGRSEGGRLDG
ncbi:MAG: aspartyl/glutamyl-tRNA amidotransferase subunit A [Peptococcaceae bacterium]|jgi:aspartyl-tRNA(Asn)/glutamyl-tRNA(Gln) amidotransferase subunit A|nr:aspartyl/glutamyl-tRNA amidotransferase subunit A [Peptococcaceae bacterium]